METPTVKSQYNWVWKGVSNQLRFTMSNQIKTITVVLNGEPREVPAGLSVATFLTHLGLPADRVAVELDRQIVRKAVWPETLIETGAQIEVVHFVGGGRS